MNSREGRFNLANPRFVVVEVHRDIDTRKLYPREKFKIPCAIELRYERVFQDNADIHPELA